MSTLYSVSLTVTIFSQTAFILQIHNSKKTSVLLHGHILFPAANEINYNVQTFIDLWEMYEECDVRMDYENIAYWKVMTNCGRFP
jgi:hypothetical protein